MLNNAMFNFWRLISSVFCGTNKQVVTVVVQIDASKAVVYDTVIQLLQRNSTGQYVYTV